ncbi:hypothetical protein HDV04_000214 [Boothiomyces sp. JEL0838]|nr:hypothetical protein HDV04_000214 [Boothiomyces sp. JEL0838]
MLTQRLFKRLYSKTIADYPVYPQVHQQLQPRPAIPKTKSPETKKALELLDSGKNFYATFELKQRPYHAALNDIIITMRMNDLKIGDVIELDRIREIGNESFVLKGNPYILPDYCTLKAVVVEHASAKEIERKHWKKSGLTKYVRNQTHHTILRLSEIKINKD